MTRFAGFEARTIPTPRGDVFARVGGAGPPLLVLHGYPQTHLMWHSSAPLLAAAFTVVAADLPGYGDSFKPPSAADHAPHAKRALAADLVAAMAALGHARFAVAGHDRGARVAYRMALDHPDAVAALTVMDIVPTADVWALADRRFAYVYWHWSFLAQPAPLPESLISAAPDAFFDHHVMRIGVGGRARRYPDDVVAAYRAQLHDAATVHAICEDYRAGATIDVAHDEADRAAGRRIGCPTLALWGSAGALPRFHDDVAAIWRAWAPASTGRAIDASHFVVEDQPETVAAAISAQLN